MTLRKMSGWSIVSLIKERKQWARGFKEQFQPPTARPRDSVELERFRGRCKWWPRGRISDLDT